VCGDGEGRKGLHVGLLLESGHRRELDSCVNNALFNGEPAMSYHQLTLEEREVISQMHYSGSGPTAIARRLDRSPSTISRELRRNCSPQGYRAVTAQKQTSKRRRERSLTRKMDDPQINEAVRTGLSQEWSPEQIAGRQQRDHPNQPSRCVSRQTIYRWLETCEYRSHFRSFLRHGRYRKRRGMDGRGRIRNRTSIEERPAEVDSRRRFGDWEGDTVHGTGHSGMIMTCVEPKSGYLVAAKMKDGTSARLNAAKERAFRSVPQKLRQTLTVDNGKEFAGHERLSQRLAMTIYFAHPYSSNERATNENTNGLLRQYFPKKTDFRDISHHALAHVTERLNNRPRKRLNYLTPLEALNKAGFALQL